MTLHEAIEKLLVQAGLPMTTTEIARALNHNKWYQKKDKSEITAYQIHGRTQNYSSLFERNGSVVSLKRRVSDQVQQNIIHLEVINQHVISGSKPVISILEMELMNEDAFKSAAQIDNLVPDEPGIYCIRLNEKNDLPEPFIQTLREREHNIIYIGIASKSLKKRFLNQELRAKGHGTFFRSIGAVLGYRPSKGSLKNKLNKRNYTFQPLDENIIIQWINENLKINWIKFDGDLDNFETDLISKHLPLINLAKNPAPLKLLSDIRTECIKLANS